MAVIYQRSETILRLLPPKSGDEKAGIELAVSLLHTEPDFGLNHLYLAAAVLCLSLKGRIAVLVSDLSASLSLFPFVIQGLEL